MERRRDPTILAIDTAAGACSAALYRAGAVRAREWAAMARGHAEALLPMVARVMAGRRFDELDAVAVTVGPGTYTGLRIGLAAARGLALAAGLPVVGITSFEAVARGARAALSPAAVLIVALETKRSDLYLQAFDASLAPLTEPRCVEPAALASALPPAIADARRRVVAGDAAARLAAALPDGLACEIAPGDGLADAAIVAVLAAERLAAGPLPDDLLPPRPLYLRPPDTTPPAADRHRLRRTPSP